jgi:hypothetical protein
MQKESGDISNLWDITTMILAAAEQYNRAEFESRDN